MLYFDGLQNYDSDPTACVSVEDDTTRMRSEFESDLYKNKVQFPRIMDKKT